jgi:hypothetical protein
VFDLFIWLLNRLGVDMEIHVTSTLPVGDLSVMNVRCRFRIPDRREMRIAA